MQAFLVVDLIDELVDVALCVVEVEIVLQTNFSCIQSVVKIFHAGIVAGVTLSKHAGNQASLSKPINVDASHVLKPLVKAENALRLPRRILNRHWCRIPAG
jgi:hypothetical protein